MCLFFLTAAAVAAAGAGRAASGARAAEAGRPAGGGGGGRVLAGPAGGCWLLPGGVAAGKALRCVPEGPAVRTECPGHRSRRRLPPPLAAACRRLLAAACSCLVVCSAVATPPGSPRAQDIGARRRVNTILRRERRAGGGGSAQALAWLLPTVRSALRAAAVFLAAPKAARVPRSGDFPGPGLARSAAEGPVGGGGGDKCRHGSSCPRGCGGARVLCARCVCCCVGAAPCGTRSCATFQPNPECMSE